MTDSLNLYTIVELEQHLALPENAGRPLELIDGEIIEKPMPTQEHGAVAANIGSQIHVFLRAKRLGRDGPEIRYQSPADPHNSLMPDWSFILGMDEAVVAEGAVQRMPDWALEVQSPHEELVEMRRKARIYLRHGATLVWLALSRHRIVEVYWADGREDVYSAGDTLDFGDLLPGLTIPVRDIFDV